VTPIAAGRGFRLEHGAGHIMSKARPDLLGFLGVNIQGCSAHCIWIGDHVAP
jgi:hypothetical protein